MLKSKNITVAIENSNYLNIFFRNFLELLGPNDYLMKNLNFEKEKRLLVWVNDLYRYVGCASTHNCKTKGRRVYVVNMNF